MKNGFGFASDFHGLGITVVDVPKDILDKLKLNGGVVISEARGSAGSSGLIKGDVIVSINNNDVATVAQFTALANELNKKKVVVFLIRRGGEALFIPVKP